MVKKKKKRKFLTPKQAVRKHLREQETKRKILEALDNIKEFLKNFLANKMHNS